MNLVHLLVPFTHGWSPETEFWFIYLSCNVFRSFYLFSRIRNYSLLATIYCTVPFRHRSQTNALALIKNFLVHPPPSSGEMIRKGAFCIAQR